jgi:hypothetical protein
VQTTASDANSAVAEDVPGVVDSDSIKKTLQCIKYELKKLKSTEVSEIVSSVDPSVLQELRDDIAAESRAVDSISELGLILSDDLNHLDLRQTATDPDRTFNTGSIDISIS